MVEDKRESKRYEMLQGKNIVDRIYHKKSGGKLRKMLTVYSDGEKLRLNFFIMDRTDPTRSEKSKGIKAKRIILMDKDLFFENIFSLKESLEHLPLPDMAIDFIDFFQKDNK